MLHGHVHVRPPGPRYGRGRDHVSVRFRLQALDGPHLTLQSPRGLKMMR